MRIAFVTFEYPPFIIGGAGIYAWHITHELSKLGHEVVVFTPEIDNINNVPINENINLRIKRVKINAQLPFPSLQFWLHLPIEIKMEHSLRKFDILHFNGVSYWFLKGKILDAPHVITVHHLVRDAMRNNKPSLVSRIRDIGGENGFLIPFIEKRCIKNTDKIISVSKFTKKCILDTYGISSDQIDTIYNGIDVEGYTLSNDECNKIKQSLCIGNKSVILFVGRVDDPRKGLDFLLKAFYEVLKIVDAHLLIVGMGDNTKMISLAKSLGIYQNLTFTGFVDSNRLKIYYSICDFYVCSSKLEGFGLTILEAMAAGKPIVATKVGAMSELLINGVNGILVESEDIASMSNSIINLLQNEDLAIKIGNINARYVTSNFNWTKNAKKVEEIYTICQHYSS